MARRKNNAVSRVALVLMMGMGFIACEEAEVNDLG